MDDEGTERMRAWLYGVIDKALATGNADARIRSGIREFEKDGQTLRELTGSEALIVRWNTNG